MSVNDEPNPMSHTLFACISWGGAHRTKRAVYISNSERLLGQSQSFQQDALLANFTIQLVRCMKVCNWYCAIALSFLAKHIYLYGSLPPVEDKSLESTATTGMACANQYYTKLEGTIAYMKCPKLLKKSVLAKVLPVPHSAFRR
jgi:predicted metal-binding protein